MGGECWNCGRYLSGGDLLEGYCWDCKASVRVSDGGYPANMTIEDDETEEETDDA